MDMLVDMSTYNLYGSYLEEVLQTNIPIAGGVEHYGMGVIPPGLNYNQMKQVFELAHAMGVISVWAWPDEAIDLIPVEYWELSHLFLET
jgi:hypothetical protein